MEYSEEELKKMPEKNGFRLRGLDMTRLETFIEMLRSQKSED